MGERVFRNNYKGHMDKTKRVWNQRREVRMAGVGRGMVEEAMRTTVIEQ